MPAERSWRSFRLRDLFALVTIAAIGFALGAPYLASSRQRQRGENCVDNLRQIGVLLQAHADQDPQGRLCTGAPDLLHDGCPDTWGWVADVINRDAQAAPWLRCPDSAAVGTATYNDLLRVSGAVPFIGPPGGRQWCGVCQSGLPNVAGQTGPFAGTKPNSPARVQFVARELRAKGYDTNYVASWHLVRSSPRFEAHLPVAEGWSVFLHSSAGTRADLIRSNGPLTAQTLKSNLHPASTIALLGCGRPQIPESLRLGNTESGRRSKNSGWLVAAMNPGLAQWDFESGALVPAPPGCDVGTQILSDRGDLSAFPAIGGTGFWRHDTRGWWAVHGRGQQKFCNLLMADGSVQPFADLNGDGLLNPGFPVTKSAAKSQTPQEAMFQDDTIELPPHKVFSGVLLHHYGKIACGEGGCRIIPVYIGPPKAKK